MAGQRRRRNERLKAIRAANGLPKRDRRRNKGDVLAQQRRYRSRYPERARDFYRSMRAKVLQHLGGACGQCGFNDPRALDIDHVDGDGRETSRFNGKKRLPMNCADYAAILAGKTGPRLQLLCANCHRIKTINSGDHRRGRNRGQGELFSWVKVGPA